MLPQGRGNQTLERAGQENISTYLPYKKIDAFLSTKPLVTLNIEDTKYSGKLAAFDAAIKGSNSFPCCSVAVCWAPPVKLKRRIWLAAWF